MTTTPETLISNALSLATTRVNTAYEALANGVKGGEGNELDIAIKKIADAMKLADKFKTLQTPRKFTYGSDRGAITTAILGPDPEEGVSAWDITKDDGTFFESLTDKRTEADGRIAAIKQDFYTKARDILDSLVGGLTIDPAKISAIQYDFVTQVYDDFMLEHRAAQHAEMRERRKLLSSLAEQGHTFLPGHAADTLNEMKLATADGTVELMRTAYYQRAENKMRLFLAKQSAMMQAIDALAQAQEAQLKAVGEYAIAVAKGVKFVVDDTYFDTLASHEYKKLNFQEIQLDAAMKLAITSAFSRAYSTHGSMDATVRDFYNYTKGTDPTMQAEDDFKQYSDAQKISIDAGIKAIEWLGKIAAAAEAAANVVVSASTTSFE